MRWIQQMDCICAGESIALGPLVVAGVGAAAAMGGANDLQPQEPGIC